jgi:asparaginyl-tRNA synthetase
LKIADIKGGPDEGLDRVGKTIVVMGWVRTLRVQSSVTFIEVIMVVTCMISMIKLF